MIEVADIVGVWELVSFEIRFSDGRSPYIPFRGAPAGQLMYDPSGYMSAILHSAHRPDLSVDRLENANRATEAEKAAAFDTYLSYAGTFRLEGDEIVHEVKRSLMPNTVGEEQRRKIRFDGDLLILSYQLTPASDVTRTYELIWRRPPLKHPEN